MTNKTRLENDKAELDRLGNEMLALELKLENNRNDEKTAKALSSVKTQYDGRSNHYQILLKYVRQYDLFEADYLETYARMLNKSKR